MTVSQTPVDHLPGVLQMEAVFVLMDMKSPQNTYLTMNHTAVLVSTGKPLFFFK